MSINSIGTVVSTSIWWAAAIGSGHDAGAVLERRAE
jgi:hypothetical protein